MDKNNVGNIANIVSNAGNVKGTSLADVKDQEIKGVGLPPIRKELDRSPLEVDREEHGTQEVDVLQAVHRDANILATKLTSIDGLPQ
jgi:hypothetical protein